MSKRVINVTMRDELTGDEINRDLDISLFAVNDCVTSDPETQLKFLVNWIEQRGNAQHNAELTVISWAIVW